MAERRPRLLVLNQYYWPGVEATANLLTELCEALAEDFDVTVVTGAAPGQMCPMALVLNAGYVLLDHPLGGRTLLSGATGTASFGPAPQTP